jgi:4-amino-4-deoxy-L-arabinose transferase-like glycosyltransferase
MANENSKIPSIRIDLRNKNVYLALLLLLSIGLLFSNLWIGDLGQDSCGYATISRSILRTNDWIVPHHEHCEELKDSWLHPPLFYWMTAISFKIFGINEFAARFISASLGLCTILFVYFIGYITSKSHKVAYLSGFVILTTHTFIDLSRKCQLDVPLTFFITLSIYLFILSIQKNENYYILLGISTGLAILTKGLPAITIFCIILLYFILTKNLKAILRPKFLLFFLFSILTICIWIIPLVHVGKFENFVDFYFTKQIALNFSRSEAAREMNFFGKFQSYFWYIGALAKKYWPWFPLLILSCYLGIKKLKKNKLVLIFILWIFILLFGYSLGSTKFFRYLAPIYPASALLIGTELADKISEKLFKKILLFSLTFLITLLLTTSVFPLYFGKIHAPNKTELKRIAPYMKMLTTKNDHIVVYKVNYWGAVSEFAFYVDRPVKLYETEATLARSLQTVRTFGYLKKEEYNNLSDKFKEYYKPILATENYYFITNIQNYEAIKKEIFPLFIHK